MLAARARGARGRGRGRRPARARLRRPRPRRCRRPAARPSLLTRPGGARGVAGPLRLRERGRSATLFEAFISASAGSGPRLALAICGLDAPDELRLALARGDSARLQAAQRGGQADGRARGAGAARPARRAATAAGAAGGPAGRADAYPVRARRPGRRSASGPRRPTPPWPTRPAGLDAEGLVRHGLGRGCGAGDRPRRARPASGSPPPRTSAPRTSSTARCGPAGWTTSSGQEAVKQQLAIFLEAARQRGEALDHVLLAGPAGAGQDLAGRRSWRPSWGSASTSPAGRCSSARATWPPSSPRSSPHDVLFIDEIHRLNRVDRGGPLPGDGGLPARRGPRPGPVRAHAAPRPAAVHAGRRHHPHGPPHHAAARPLRRLPPARLLRRRRPRGHRPPLGRPAGRGDRRRGRGGHRRALARHAAHRQPAAAPGARRRPGARPRRASTGRWPRRPCELLEVDALGLDELDRQILRRLAETFEGRPVGLGTLADAWARPPDTIEDVYEPYLLQEGLLKRTPRGRVATPRAYRHLGLVPPADTGQPGLF